VLHLGLPWWYTRHVADSAGRSPQGCWDPSSRASASTGVSGSPALQGTWYLREKRELIKTLQPRDCLRGRTVNATVSGQGTWYLAQSLPAGVPGLWLNNRTPTQPQLYEFELGGVAVQHPDASVNGLESRYAMYVRMCNVSRSQRGSLPSRLLV
jgi:hypothetical protein